MFSGQTEGRLREANMRKAFLAQEQEAAEEMKRVGEEAMKQAHEDYNNAQKLFHQAANSMPSGVVISLPPRLCDFISFVVHSWSNCLSESARYGSGADHADKKKR